MRWKLKRAPQKKGQRKKRRKRENRFPGWRQQCDVATSSENTPHSNPTHTLHHFFPDSFQSFDNFFFFLLGVVLFSFFYFLFFWRFLVIDTRFFQCDSGPRGNFSRFQRRFSLWKPGNRPLIDLFHQFRYSSTKFMLNIWGFQLSFPLNADSLVQIRSALMAERRSVIHSRNSVLKWQ